MGGFPYLSALVRNAAEQKFGANYQKMQRALEAASTVAISDRRLREIAQNRPRCSNIRLSLDELSALNGFLAKHGFVLVDESRLLRELTQSGRLKFVVGAYPRADAGRNDVSYWDFLSVVAIVGSLGRNQSVADIDILGIVKPPVMVAHELPIDGDDMSAVIVGSPRAVTASEQALAKFFRIDPCKLGTAVAECGLGFIWPDAAQVGSSFAIAGNNVKCPDDSIVPADARLNDKSWGLIAGGKVYLEKLSHAAAKKRKNGRETELPTYALVTVERLKQGRMRLVFAGTTGPATYIAARALVSELLSGMTPDDKPGAGRWVVLMGTYREVEGRLGDDREVNPTATKVIFGPCDRPSV